MMLALSNIFPKHKLFFLSFTYCTYLMTDVPYKNNLQKVLAEKKEEKINYVYLLKLVEN
jgi:hypothetical protein